METPREMESHPETVYIMGMNIIKSVPIKCAYRHDYFGETKKDTDLDLLSKIKYSSTNINMLTSPFTNQSIHKSPSCHRLPFAAHSHHYRQALQLWCLMVVQS